MSQHDRSKGFVKMNPNKKELLPGWKPVSWCISLNEEHDVWISSLYPASRRIRRITR